MKTSPAADKNRIPDARHEINRRANRHGADFFGRAEGISVAAGWMGTQRGGTGDDLGCSDPEWVPSPSSPPWPPSTAAPPLLSPKFQNFPNRRLLCEANSGGRVPFSGLSKKQKKTLLSGFECRLTLELAQDQRLQAHAARAAGYWFNKRLLLCH